MKNPKAKGNNFELKIAKLLTEWSGFKFMRTPMSGAIHNFNDKRVVSDIVPPLSIGNFPFSIECKCQEVPWDFDFILKGTSKFWSFWEQASSDASSENLIPMLVFTKNYRDTYMAIPYNISNQLNLGEEGTAHIKVGAQDIIIVSFDTFLKNNSIEKVLKVHG